MNHTTTFQSIFKQIVSSTKLQSILNTQKYIDATRKFIASELLTFFAEPH